MGIRGMDRGRWGIMWAREKWRRRKQIEFVVFGPPEKIQENLRDNGYAISPTVIAGYRVCTKLVRRTKKLLQAEVDYLLQFDLANEEGKGFKGAVEVAMNPLWGLGK